MGTKQERGFRGHHGSGKRIRKNAHLVVPRHTWGENLEMH